MSRNLCPFLVCLLIAWSASSARADEATVAEYLKYLPAHTNSITVVRVAEIKNSAVAREHGWGDSNSELWLAGSELLPRWVSLVVRGGHFHFGEPRRDWTISVTPLPQHLELTQLAHGTGAKTQQVSGKSTFLSPRGAYVTQLNRTTLGVLSPPDRADLARWINDVNQGPELTLPAYLAEACADDPAQIVFARDLEAVFDRWLLREWLQQSETLRGTPAQVAAMGQLLDSIRGVKLSITVDEFISATLRFEFSIPVTNSGKYGHALLMEYLAEQGAHLEDLENAEVTQSGNELVMRMDAFSPSGLQRVLSMILSPSPEPARVETAGEQPATPTDPVEEGPRGPTLKDTKAYFDAVQRMLGDLERQTQKSNDYLKTAVWHDQYAQKIDQLSYSGVEPQMLEFGRETSNRLRALAASLRGVPLQVNALANSITYNTYVESRWWAARSPYGRNITGFNVQSNLAQIREQQAQAVAAGAKERDSIWAMLVDSRNKIRKAMYEKYEVDFGGHDK
jgi:hypothetical protein